MNLVQHSTVYYVDVRLGKDGVKAYVENGREGAIEWLRTQGRQNIESLK